MRLLAKAILPQGFRAAGIHCGVKASQNKKDLGLLYSCAPCTSAGVFTANRVQAATVKVCKRQLRRGTSKAIIVNSGNANCCVGQQGIQDANTIIRATAQELGISPGDILIASTGIIGKPLPTAKVTHALPNLCDRLSEQGFLGFVDSILTTDTVGKAVSVALTIGNKRVVITGCAKGSGMIAPQLETQSPHATMLSFIVTDAAVSTSLLKAALVSAAEQSFNRISIDGCMSTNDTVLLLANAAAGNNLLVQKNNDFKKFNGALLFVCSRLARMIIQDAEGGTKQIAITIHGAKTQSEAKNAASAIANSALFKTAMFGENPNWGRIVAALGAAGIALDEKKLEIAFNRHKVFYKGKPYPIRSKRLLEPSQIQVFVDLKRGAHRYQLSTSDLSTEYVRINAAYN